MHKGFTLIQLSILLVVASLVLVAILPSSRTNLNANNDSAARLNGILQALREYEATNARLPCPADATQPIGSSTYGQAAANAGTTTNCTGGTPAANYVDATNNIAIGMVPVHTLGLSNDYALDGYGRDFTYAVDTNATSCFSGSLPGKITVTDNGTPVSTVVAIVSHGADGHGAFIPVTGSSGTAVRLNAGSTDTDQLTNAHVNSSFAPVTPLTNFVRKQPTPTFDDLVTYKSPLWNINNAPLASAPLLPSIAPPANGTYFTGQSLTFSVTYGSTVSVTGSPRLALSIPQSGGGTATHYAGYASSSGNTATFTYTVQSTDYAPSAPSGVSVSSPINLNGGTILVAGANACLSFTPPSLNSILLNPLTIYISDTGNNRVQYFNGSGVYQGQFGSAGTGNGQFSMGTFSYLALDASNNVWVGDPGNLRMQEFNSTGTYGNQVGGSWGFGYAYGIATDASSNVWVVHGTSTLGEYNSSGSSLQQFTLAFNPEGGDAVDAGGNIWLADYHDGNTYYEYANSGTQTAAFTPTGAAKVTYPYGMAVDGGSNIWVADGSNIKRYNSSGTFIAEAGCGGVESECGASSAPGSFGGIIGQIAIDPTGNVWAADYANNRVEEFDNCGNFLFQFGASGSGNGLFNAPFGIAVTGKPGGGGACITAVTPPASGTYSTGQVLTFTVSYNQAVTVTGTPQLVLTIGSNTRYASYASGSGTTSLTFQYTVQASDTATGIAIASSINLNGGSISSGGISANLNFTPPSMGGITLNSTAFMLVADSNNNRVQMLSLTGSYISQIGRCSSGTCATGTGNGQFNFPVGTAIDGSNNIWVTDGNNNRVEEFSSSGSYMSQFGSSGTGSGQFNFPSGIAVDGSGYIWVSDFTNNRVQKFNSSGTFQLGIGAGYQGIGGSIGSPGSSSGQFNEPYAIHFDASGNVYISDTLGDRVQKFSSNGSFMQAYGPSIASYGAMSGVEDFAIDGCRNLWIEDGSNNKLVEVDYAGNYTTSFSAAYPQSLAIDSTGLLYDLAWNGSNTNAVDTYNTSGTLQATYGSFGLLNGKFRNALGITLAGSAPTTLPLSGCPAVILSAAGPANGTYTTGSTLGFAVTYDQPVTVTGTPQISVTIGGNTRKANYVSGSGTATLTFQYTVAFNDNAQSGITMNVPIGLNGGTITSNSINSDLYFPQPTLTGVLVNPVSYSNFYIADSTNHRVRMVTSSTGYISTVAGTGTSGTATAGAATSSKLNTPIGVAVDTSGNLYISDTGNHQVFKVNTSGTLSIFAGTGTSGTVTAGAATSSMLNAPEGLATDSSGNVYIADPSNHEVLKVNGSGTLSIFAGTGTSGTVTAGAATSSKLNSPLGVAADGFGNVFIADGGNHEVLKVASGTLSIYAGTGTSGSLNDNNGSLATSARLNGPWGVAADTSDNVYISDSANDVVLAVNASNGKIGIIVGTVGTGSYTGDGGTATSATMNAPKGVAVDTAGNVYIVDLLNERVRWILGSYGTIYPIAGNGTAGYSGDGAAATSGEINSPAGIAVSR